MYFVDEGHLPHCWTLVRYLSTYSHWGHVIHGQFLSFEEGKIGVLKASVRYRAMGLALCLVVLDVMVEISKLIYAKRSESAVRRVQGALNRDATRYVHQNLTKIVVCTELDELKEIQAFMV